MRPVEASGIRALSVSLGRGSVTLTAGEGDAVSGEITSPDPRAEEEVAVATFGHELRITSNERSTVFGFGNPEVHVRLTVPERLDLDVTVGSADVSADVVLGRTRVKSGSGDVRLAGTAQLSAQTGSGDIAVLEVREGAEVMIGSGDIRVDTAHGALAIRSASGDVTIGAVHGDVQAKTASGDLGIGATTASVTAKSASGDITVGVADTMPAWLDLKSASGEVDIAIPPSREPAEGEPFVSLYLRSGSGDIRVTRA